MLTGNQTGMLLLDYICSQRQKHHKMPADPVMVKTIVTMDMAQQIAEHYGLRTINVLTGFKFIGEQIGKLEEQKKADSYVFGFEESYGYLTGSYVRDKDGVNGACIICEMFSYYATKGIGLLDKLDELYRMYGYCLNTLHSYEFDGSAGFVKMQKIMKAFRGDVEKFGNKKVLKLLDYQVRFFLGESSEYYANLHRKIMRAIDKIQLAGRIPTVEAIMEETKISRKLIKRELMVDYTRVSYEMLGEL